MNFALVIANTSSNSEPKRTVTLGLTAMVFHDAQGLVAAYKAPRPMGFVSWANEPDQSQKT